MHVDVVAIVIQNVNADRNPFLARQVLAFLRNPLSGCQIDRAEVVHLLRRLAANDKLRRRILRGRSNRKRQNDEN